jgi:polyhydroxyalkanoate synthase subunit PhaC
MAKRENGKAADQAAMQASEALEPEGGLADLDPLAFGRALASTWIQLGLRPWTALEPMRHFALGALEAAAATGARALGEEKEGPLAPEPKDRRFGDRAWQQNPFYFGLLQGYLLWQRLVRELVDAADGGDPVQTEKARFAAGLLTDAVAPTNFLSTNPAALKKAFDTGGLSLARGLANFLEDAASNGGLPRQVDDSGFELGRDLAATPGKVILRNELMELLQYEAQTETVFETPVLLSPPWINKYYIMDLAPQRSFAEWAVKHGHTVFAISYRNPDESMRDVGLDDYLLHGPQAAIDAIQEITGTAQVNVVGLCLGGTLTAMLLAFLEKHDDDRVRSATLLNTLLDFSEPGVLGNFVDPATIARLERKMAKRGYLDSAQMSRTFDVVRANDLIWSYVASNWLMGETPPAFDILAWNADGTRMPAKMHSFYLRTCYLQNELARGELELAGEQLGLGEIAEDVYLVGAREDHIAPWRASYKATQLLGGDVRFVLSSSGHIAGIVNPPGPKARHGTNDELPAASDAWLAGATEHEGSWWEDWAVWISKRAGERRKPPRMGSKRHRPVGDAPGAYVLQRS